MAADQNRVQAAAQFLFSAHQARKVFSPIPEHIAPRDFDNAYAVQEEFMKLSAPAKGEVAGYKIAVTTRVMQQMLGLNEPLSGCIMARTIHQSPAVLRATNYVRLGVECEIAVRLSADLTPAGAPYSREAIERAVGAVMPAFELIDDRNADYSNLAAQLLSGIADNGWNAGVVLGLPLTEWRSIDLAGVRGTLEINDATAGEGQGKDVMGHPFEALTWFVNHLARRGKSLQRGAVIMTGSIIATKFVNAGDKLRFVVGELGEVSLRVE